MKVLITGGNGQLGKTFASLLAKKTSKHHVTITSSKELDVTDFQKVTSFLAKEKFDYCINCAAYTKVDLAEEEKELAYLINATAVENLAKACKNEDTTLIHISTDYVFDGKKRTPYVENDSTNPLNVYGASKLKGEALVFENHKNSFVIRTSWLYSKEFGNNFYKFVKNAVLNSKTIQILDNQFGAPTNTVDLATAILKIIETKCTAYGLYHFSGKGTTNWFEFAKEIAVLTSGNSDLIQPTQNFPTKATRSPYSKLNSTKIEEALNIEILSWKESLRY